MQALVRRQIEDACAFVRQHASTRPMIAGNALWSWAAGIPARDVDIWIRRGAWTWWHMRKYPRIGSADGSSLGGVDGNLIRRAWVAGNTPVDIVIHRYDDPCAVFDYFHLMVSWPYSNPGMEDLGHGSSCVLLRDRPRPAVQRRGMNAIELYSLGRFEVNPRAPLPRGEEYRMRTRQNPLWGSGHAGAAMERLLVLLDSMRGVDPREMPRAVLI